MDPNARRVAHRFLARRYQLSPEEDADLALGQWQRDIGDAAVKALKSLRGVTSVKRWTINHMDEVEISFSWPHTNSAPLGKWDLEEIQILGEMVAIKHLKSRLQGLLGVGRTHNQWGGFWTSVDHMYVSFKGKDLDGWILRISPHSAR